jgi:hypothetical protein
MIDIWDFRNLVEGDVYVTKSSENSEWLWGGKLHSTLLNSWLKRIQITGIYTVVWFMGSYIGAV